MPRCTVSHGTCAHIRRQRRILFFVLYKDRPDFSFARHFNLLPFEGLPSQRLISRNDLPLLASYARIMYGRASFRWQNQLSPKWRQIEPGELAIDIHKKRIVFLSSTCKPLEQIADVKSSIMRIRWRTELFGKVVGTTFDRDKVIQGEKRRTWALAMELNHSHAFTSYLLQVVMYYRWQSCLIIRLEIFMHLKCMKYSHGTNSYLDSSFLVIFIKIWNGMKIRGLLVTPLMKFQSDLYNTYNICVNIMLRVPIFS